MKKKAKEEKEKKKEEMDPLIVNLEYMVFPDAKSFIELRNQLSEEGKEQLDRMLKEGKVKILT